MNYIDNILILSLIVSAFFLGRHITRRDNEKIESIYDYLLRLNAAQNGVGYVAPPTKKRAPIGQPFMDKLQQNGHATQKI